MFFFTYLFLLYFFGVFIFYCIFKTYLCFNVCIFLTYLFVVTDFLTYIYQGIYILNLIIFLCTCILACIWVYLPEIKVFVFIILYKWSSSCGAISRKVSYHRPLLISALCHSDQIFILHVLHPCLAVVSPCGSVSSSAS